MSFNTTIWPEKNVKYALLVTFLVYMITVYVVYLNFPKLSETEKLKVKIPKNENEVKNLASVLVKYRDDHYMVLFFAVTSLYILLQSCAIPGSIMLSLLSGYLFPLPVALFLICLCSATGATICYCISYCFGRDLILKYFPERASEYRAKVAKNRSFLLSYILFLRITPIIPNWVINLVSPLIDVPISTFFWATFFGVAPPSFLHIQTVKTLEKIVASGSSHFSYTNIGVLLICATLALSPVIYKFNQKNKS
ncbi:transmembrane protein 41 homolog [Panonychus citri]|uniref:transmembrane protein 41 homolog n=1 Tax=Panonychus citri TaxID=50023 RepID=UPI002306DD20|nr:transmembrane protein 41 homolog [Panonychus citri]